MLDKIKEVTSNKINVSCIWENLTQMKNVDL